MPMYDYRCGKCTDVFEVVARMGQAPDEPECPTCEGGLGARVFGSGVAIHTGSSASSFDDFDMDAMGGMPDLGGMGGHGHDHGHGHSHDDFGMDDFGMDDF